MPLDTFVALVSFALVTSFTPGPNNLMVTASGMNFGFVRTIPHMAGIDIGFLLLMAACAGGLGVVFAAYPPLQTVLKVAGALYMVWLAWKVANAGQAREADPAARPLTFLQAAAFQWVNPKAVVISLSTIAIYVRPGREMADFGIIFVVFGVSTVLSVLTWTGFGVALRKFLQDPLRARIFNVSMAVLLVASIVPMVF